MPGEVHLDEAFTAQRLKDVSQRRFPVLDLASHFRFSPGAEANSFLLLGDGQQLPLGELRAQNDRFDQVDLLTLSACDTALGGGRDVPSGSDPPGRSAGPGLLGPPLATPLPCRNGQRGRVLPQVGRELCRQPGWRA